MPWGGLYKGGFAFPHSTGVGRAAPSPAAIPSLRKTPPRRGVGGVARHPSFDAQPW